MEILIITILIIIIIKIFLLSFKYRIRGKRGEKIVANILKKLPVDDYIVLNDITIKNRDGTSQIDHLVISPFGLFVIETKYYQGWLFGSEESENWTQAIYTEKYQFYSPIQQNRGHIKALKYNLAKYPDIPYYSIVVLAGSCEFKNFDQVKTTVIYPDELYATIRNFSSQKFLTDIQVAEIREIIQKVTITDKGHEKLHIENVRNKAAIAENEIKRGTCPRCDGILVERKGEHGKFLGCSNYPKCKFKTKKINR